MEITVRRIWADIPARQPELLDRDAYGRIGHTPSWRGYAFQMAPIALWSNFPFLRRLRVPALVMTGDDEPIVRVFNGRVLAAMIPGAQLRIMRGAGHLFLIDKARRSAEAITESLG